MLGGYLCSNIFFSSSSSDSTSRSMNNLLGAVERGLMKSEQQCESATIVGSIVLTLFGVFCTLHVISRENKLVYYQVRDRAHKTTTSLPGAETH